MKFYKMNNVVFGWNQPLDLEEVTPNTTDAAVEKHVPVYEVNGNVVNVRVGSVDHPMVAEHYIEWIMVETTNGSQVVYLSSDQAPTATFVLKDGESVLHVYSYCNLHGLWQA